MFIVLEGIDGSGKSSLAKNIASSLEPKTTVFSEPTKETPYGIELREILQSQKAIDQKLKMQMRELFWHDRLWDIEHNIKPCLEKGEHVVLDRYYFSTAAYQASDVNEVSKIIEQYMQAREILKPDVVFFLDLSAKSAFRRIASRGQSKELFESLERLEKIANNYEHIWLSYEFDFPVYKINAQESSEQVLASVLQFIKKL